MPHVMIKPILVLALVAAALAGAYYVGYHQCQKKYLSEAVEQANRNAEAMASEVKSTEAKTRAIYERKIKLMQTRLSGGCILGDDYRVLHDTAAAAEKGAGEGSIGSAAFALHIADNYARCLQNKAWLEECLNLCR